MDLIDSWFAALDVAPGVALPIALAVLLLVALAADWLTHRLLLRVVRRAVAITPTTYDDALLARGVLDRLAHVVPALVVVIGLPHVPALPPSLVTVLRNVANAYMILTVAMALGQLLRAVGDVYARVDPDRARAKPITGYLQLVAIVLYIVAAILIVATLIEKSPLLLFSGLGAMTAVLLLVFKDTILSFVASVQLSSNDMLRVGDWLEMPSLNADGEVREIALHTVKVQNWDRTITTIPTWRLINESFRNWRGMSESGGRRIKRALLLDQTSVRFLSADEHAALSRFTLIDRYLREKQAELTAHNERLLAEGRDPVNVRRVTNLGTFRAYVEAYLRAHPRIRQDMTCMVRQLPPAPTGLPLELYCFTATTAWAEYEGIQADVFDHLYAILPEFGLRVAQQVTGADVQAGLRAATAG